MKYILTFSLMLMALLGFGQPTFTGADLNGNVGDTFHIVICEYADPGNGGANQTWDFSKLSTLGGHQLSYVDSKNTDKAGDFPASNIAWSHQGNVSYLRQDAKAYSLIGSASNGLITKYADPEDILRYPVKYNDSYEDTWGATRLINGVTSIRIGKTTVTADGYGTLITPTGTYTNVMRVHVLQEYSDSSVLVKTNYENDHYMWYVKDISYPAFTSYEFTSDLGSTSSASYITTKQISDISKPKINTAFNLYPNPASSEIRVTMTQPTGKKLTWEIVDVTGKAHLNGQEMMGREEMFILDVSFLPKGMYYLRINNAAGTASSALVID